MISAIGSRPKLPVTKARGIFYAGDMVLGAATVVESVASGKNAAAEADAFIRGEARPKFKNRAKSRVILAGVPLRPVPLDADFFGRRILSPFLLSAAPHSDGYEQMRKAYERGWSGGVMKTAFDNVPIHIPAGYMFALTRSTYGNCDNVSGHPLDRVCREVAKLVKEFPDRLTLASTGGPVTGHDEADKRVWQSNTRKLQNAGAMGVEYSLSCPQGGDGTHGDVVSQNAGLTAKIIDWVMEASARRQSEAVQAHRRRHRDPADHQGDSGSVRALSEQEGRRHARQQFSVARVSQSGKPPLGGRRRHRHVGRRRFADQQSHARQSFQHWASPSRATAAR